MERFRGVEAFCALDRGIRLRGYQLEVARAVAESVRDRLGLSFVVLFPRQSGKNELQAQLECYFLKLFSAEEGEIVKVSPTWKPQSLNAMRRLERVLGRNLVTAGKWAKESGYIYRVGKARIFFLSGAPEANIVGATASTLLEVDEAQDVLPAKFDKDIAPMAASTNATRVFWGTAWTSATLLAREYRAAQAQQAADGRRRVFRLTADDVAREVPAYAAFVAEQVARLGRSHPMVRTQYFSEEIDAEGGLFPPARLALMQGTHAAQAAPAPGGLYCLLLDVAGEDEAAQDSSAGGAERGAVLKNPGRDATALTVVAVDLTTLADPALKAPTYRVMQRRSWTGVRHTRLYAELAALAKLWAARWLVVDATGVGAGLASFLEKALPGRVAPFVFNAATKSKLGWDFLSVVETGRFQDYADSDEPLRRAFLRQCAACQMEAGAGPERRLTWGVPDGLRSPETGEREHDDLLLSAALTAVLDGLPWPAQGGAGMVRRADPLREMDHEGY